MWIELRSLLEDYDSHFVALSGQREGLCVLWRKKRYSQPLEAYSPLMRRYTMGQTGTLGLAVGKTNSMAALITLKDLDNAEEEICFVNVQLTTDPKKESLKAEEVGICSAKDRP